MTGSICRECGGPNDILHTPTECAGLQQAVDLPEVHRYHLAIIAGIIKAAPSPIAAAHRLYTDGHLGPPGSPS